MLPFIKWELYDESFKLFDLLRQHVVHLDIAPVQRDGAGHSALETADAVGDGAGALSFRIHANHLAALTAVKISAGNAAAGTLLRRKQIIASAGVEKSYSNLLSLGNRPEGKKSRLEAIPVSSFIPSEKFEVKEKFMKEYEISQREEGKDK